MFVGAKGNSNLDINNKVLKKVIILEIGVNNGENRGVLCDDFNGLKNQRVQDLAKSLDFS